MKTITRKDFNFTIDNNEFGPTDYSIDDHAKLPELVDLFNKNYQKLALDQRELNFNHVGFLIEYIFSHAPKTIDAINQAAGRTKRQYLDKIKNRKRKERSKEISEQLGKGTSIYLQSINLLIDFIMWNNGIYSRPTFDDIASNKVQPFVSQEFAIKFVTTILTYILEIEPAEDENINAGAIITRHEYFKREYQKFKKNPVYVPGLPAGTIISSAQNSECKVKYSKTYFTELKFKKDK